MDNKKKADKELKFIYNSTLIKEREAYAYAESLDQHYINPVDVSKQNLTERQWAGVATKLNVAVKDLINEHDDYYVDAMKGKEFEENDLLQLMAEHPQIVKTPIIESHNYASFIKSSYDFNEMDLAFQDIKNHMTNKDENGG